MDDNTDLDTNHDDVSFMRILLRTVRGLSAVSSSTLAFSTAEDEEEK
ncbi:MAG: hypothetical protein ABIQ04_03675 [Candidatus Saccharimonadales bacterium]